MAIPTKRVTAAPTVPNGDWVIDFHGMTIDSRKIDHVGPLLKVEGRLLLPITIGHSIQRFYLDRIPGETDVAYYERGHKQRRELLEKANLARHRPRYLITDQR